jgi:hypothetical protein
LEVDNPVAATAAVGHKDEVVELVVALGSCAHAETGLHTAGAFRDGPGSHRGAGLAARPDALTLAAVTLGIALISIDVIRFVRLATARTRSRRIPITLDAAVRRVFDVV